MRKPTGRKRKIANVSQYTIDLPESKLLKRGVGILQASEEKQFTRQHIISDIRKEFPNTNESLKVISNAGSGNGAFKLEEQLAGIYKNMQFLSIEFLPSAILATQERLKALIRKFGTRFGIVHAKNSELAEEEHQSKLNLKEGIDIIWNDGMSVFNTSVENALLAIIEAHVRYRCFDKCWKNGHSPLIFITVALKGMSKATRLNKEAEKMAKDAGLSREANGKNAKTFNLATGIWLYFNSLAKGHNLKFLPVSTVKYKSTPKLRGASMLLMCFKAGPQDFKIEQYCADLPEVKNFMVDHQVRLLKEAAILKRQKDQMRKHFDKNSDYNAIGAGIKKHIQVTCDPSTGEIIDYGKVIQVHKAMFTSHQIKQDNPVVGGIPVQEIINLITQHKKT